MDEETPKAEYWGGVDEDAYRVIGREAAAEAHAGAALLAEMRFWTRIMKEHSMLMRTGSKA